MLRLRESHKKPIYSVMYNHVDASLAHVWATVGANRVTLYHLDDKNETQSATRPVACTALSEKRRREVWTPPPLSGRSIVTMQAYRDEDEDEIFYCCDWGVKVLPNGAAACFLAVGGAMRHIKVLDCCSEP